MRISQVQAYVLESASRFTGDTHEAWLTWKNRRVSRRVLEVMERQGLICINRHPSQGWSVRPASPQTSQEA